MVCPYCGTYRKISGSLVGKVIKGEICVLCPGCNKRYVVDRVTAFMGDPPEEKKMCRRCKKQEAEKGLMVCIDCWNWEVQKRHDDKRRMLVESERHERAQIKPRRMTLEEKAARAQAIGISYGKYEMLRHMGKIKEE